MTASKQNEAPPDGTYRARATRCGLGRVEFSGEWEGHVLHCAEVRFCLLDAPYEGREFTWRGWLTAGAAPLTAPVLVVCGARMRNDDPSDLEGVLGTEVELELRTIPCVEAPGVVKTYVSDVRDARSA